MRSTREPDIGKVCSSGSNVSKTEDIGLSRRGFLTAALASGSAAARAPLAEQLSADDAAMPTDTMAPMLTSLRARFHRWRRHN